MARCSLSLAVVLLLGLCHTSSFILDTVEPVVTVINHRPEAHEDAGSPAQLFVIPDSTKNRSVSLLIRQPNAPFSRFKRLFLYRTSAHRHAHRITEHVEEMKDGTSTVCEFVECQRWISFALY